MEKCSVLGKNLLVIHTISIYTDGMKKSTEIATNPTASIESSLHELEQQHSVLLAELADIGLVLRGSIALRLCICGNPRCRCRANPPVLHGPYYKWTRKVAGKTVNATLHHSDESEEYIALKHSLTAEQIRWFQAGSALNLIKEKFVTSA